MDRAGRARLERGFVENGYALNSAELTIRDLATLEQCEQVRRSTLRQLGELCRRVHCAAQGDRLVMRGKADRLRALPSLLAKAQDQIDTCSGAVKSARDDLDARQKRQQRCEKSERAMKKARKDLDVALAEQMSLTSERGALDQERSLAAERGDEWPGAEGLAPAPLSASAALAAYAKRKTHERQKAESKSRDKYAAQRCCAIALW
jgi:hypothetical protein